MKSIWKQTPPLDSLNKFRKAGLDELLGIKVVARGNNWLSAEMPVTDNHKQPFGIVHGGATATLAETVASIAGFLCVDAKLQSTVGLELNINHLKPVTDGILIAKATGAHIGRTTQVWQIDIYNQDLKQVSTARLTTMTINKK
jgi:1,4-dihydroxy-2-naphthoyl-CoA hydrolase